MEFEDPVAVGAWLKYDHDRMTSDGVAPLWREADRLANVTWRVAGVLVDHCDPKRIEHDVTTLMAQRITTLALG